MSWRGLEVGVTRDESDQQYNVEVILGLPRFIFFVWRFLRSLITWAARIHERAGAPAPAPAPSGQTPRTEQATHGGPGRDGGEGGGAGGVGGEKPRWDGMQGAMGDGGCGTTNGQPRVKQVGSRVEAYVAHGEAGDASKEEADIIAHDQQHHEVCEGARATAGSASD